MTTAEIVAVLRELAKCERDWVIGDIDRHQYRAASLEEAASRLERGEGTCRWEEERSGEYWATGCGEFFTFDADGPTENNMRYCCYCGKLLQAVPYREEDDDMDDAEIDVEAAGNAPEPAKVYAPWTDAQVERLKARQADTTRHPYTCHIDGSVLEPEREGWHCPTTSAHIICQYWALAADLAPEPPAAPDPGRRKTLDDAFDDPDPVRHPDPAPSAPPEDPVEVATIRAQVAAGMKPWDAADVGTVLAYADTLRESLRLARLSYVPQDIAVGLLELLEDAGYGKPGTGGNTLWSMVHKAVKDADALRARCTRLIEALRDAVYTITTASKGSIGSVDNVYLPQIYVTTVERWRAALAEEAT